MAHRIGAESKPQFQTRGEELYSFFTSLGYSGSKHQKPEHFEYVFQNEKFARFAKLLMTKVKSCNELSPEEIHRYVSILIAVVLHFEYA